MARQATDAEKQMHELAQQSAGAEDTAPTEIPSGDTDPTGEQTPPKRKRGRPSNAEKALDDALTETQIPGGADNTGPKPGPKPGRKKSSGGGVNGSALGKQLVGIHQLAAMLTGVTELALSDPEGEQLGQAIAGVCEQYNLSIDGKTGAFLGLIGTAAVIYGPRYFAFNARMAYMRAQQSQQPIQTPGGYTHDHGPVAPH